MTDAGTTASPAATGAVLGGGSQGRTADRLLAPVPIAPLVCFRIAFGAIMVWEVCRYFAAGWIRSHFLTGRFAFKFYGFEWVQAWPGRWMYVHFAVVGLAALGITLGAAYRLSAFLFFMGFTYIFLLDQIYYLNHLYLVCLLAFLLMFLPAQRGLSLDARLWPSIRASHVPAWTLFLLRFQIGVVYFFGGIAKLNRDWLRGEPIRNWLLSRSDWPVVGSALKTEPAVWVICYGGLLLDLFIVPMLLWRRTRVWAVAGLIAFHLSNAVLFNIGIFPWLMLAVTPLFFPIEWWARVNRWLPGLERDRDRPPSADPPGAQKGVAGLSVEPVLISVADTANGARSASEGLSREPLACASGSIRYRTGNRLQEPACGAPSIRHRKLVTGLVAAYVLVQMLVPLRHFLYPGVVHWTEEGHRFSWHMKLRAKRAYRADFVAHDPDRKVHWRVSTERYLPRRLLMQAATRPDMVLQLARRISADLRREGHANVEIHALVIVGLNDHPPQALIDPNVDLGRQKRSLRRAGWILPLAPRTQGSRPVPPPTEPDEESPQSEEEL